MTGNNPIVISSINRQQFYEHVDVKGAVKEAERLAALLNQPFIVYVPVSISKPAPKVLTEKVGHVQRVMGGCLTNEPPF